MLDTCLAVLAKAAALARRWRLRSEYQSITWSRSDLAESGLQARTQASQVKLVYSLLKVSEYPNSCRADCDFYMLSIVLVFHMFPVPNSINRLPA